MNDERTGTLPSYYEGILRLYKVMIKVVFSIMNYDQLKTWDSTWVDLRPRETVHIFDFTDGVELSWMLIVNFCRKSFAGSCFPIWDVLGCSGFERKQATHPSSANQHQELNLNVMMWKHALSRARVIRPVGRFACAAVDRFASMAKQISEYIRVYYIYVYISS